MCWITVVFSCCGRKINMHQVEKCWVKNGRKKVKDYWHKFVFLVFLNMPQALSLQCGGQSSDWRWGPFVLLFMEGSMLRVAHISLIETYRLRLVPSQRRRHVGRACRLPFRWRKCWRSRHQPRRSCQMASVHRAGFRVRDSRVPSRHYQSGLQLVQRG